jgi:hypothetical protein
MSVGEVLFEQDYRGYVWRLSINNHNGHSYVDFRKWYYDDTAALKPTRDGVAIPVRRLPEMAGNIDLYLEQIGQ